MPESVLAAVDPMSMILSNRAYLIWVELHHPHVPKVAEIQAVLKTMSPEDQRSAVSRAKNLAAYGHAVEAAYAAQSKAS